MKPAPGRKTTVWSSLGVGVLDVGLDTDDEGADLVVVADLAASGEAAIAIAREDQGAGKAGGSGPWGQEHGFLVVFAPAPAGIHTDIEPGPGEERNGRDDGRRGLVGEIGRLTGRGESNCCCAHEQV